MIAAGWPVALAKEALQVRPSSLRPVSPHKNTSRACLEFAPTLLLFCFGHELCYHAACSYVNAKAAGNHCRSALASVGHSVAGAARSKR